MEQWTVLILWWSSSIWVKANKQAFSRDHNIKLSNIFYILLSNIYSLNISRLKEARRLIFTYYLFISYFLFIT